MGIKISGRIIIPFAGKNKFVIHKEGGDFNKKESEPKKSEKETLRKLQCTFCGKGGIMFWDKVAGLYYFYFLFQTLKISIIKKYIGKQELA